MRNELYKKGLPVGMVFILVFVVCNSAVGINVQINETPIQNLYQQGGKPDLEIVDAYGVSLWDGMGYMPYIKLVIMNKGNATLKTDDIACEQTVKYAFTNQILFQYTRHASILNTPVPPGGTTDMYFHTLHHLGYYRNFFEFDPDNKINELNETNNKVWAYFFFRAFLKPKRCSELKYWTTGNEGVGEVPQSISSQSPQYITQQSSIPSSYQLYQKPLNTY